MVSVVEMPMGRAKRADEVEDKPTTHVRVFPDIAEMVGWIVRVEKRSNKGGAAQLLDPMIRPQITARYRKYLPHIEKLKAMEQELKQAEEEAAIAIKKSGKPPE